METEKDGSEQESGYQIQIDPKTGQEYYLLTSEEISKKQVNIDRRTGRKYDPWTGREIREKYKWMEDEKGPDKPT